MNFSGNTLVTGCRYLDGVAACGNSTELGMASYCYSLSEDLPGYGKQTNDCQHLDWRAIRSPHLDVYAGPQQGCARIWPSRGIGSWCEPLRENFFGKGRSAEENCYGNEKFIVPEDHEELCWPAELLDIDPIKRPPLLLCCLSCHILFQTALDGTCQKG